MLVISDEPYRPLVFDGLRAAGDAAPSSSARCWPGAGRRPWRLPASASAIWRFRRTSPEAAALRDACTFANRVLGYINAPAIWQLVVARSARRHRGCRPVPGQARPAVRRLAAMGYDAPRPQRLVLRLSPGRPSPTTWPSSASCSRKASWPFPAWVSAAAATCGFRSPSHARDRALAARASSGPSPSADEPLRPAAFTAAERAVFRRLRTPESIQRFLDCELAYNKEPHGDTCRSPRRVLRDRIAHCMEGALFGAAALRMLGFPPLLLDLEAVRDDDHVLAVFRLAAAGAPSPSRITRDCATGSRSTARCASWRCRTSSTTTICGGRRPCGPIPAR